MKVKDLISDLKPEVIAEGSLEEDIDGIYIGDLLSNVMSKAKEKNLWITIQGHQNVIAVAQLTGVAAVIVVEDFAIEEAAVKRAKENGINLLRTSLTAYELIRKLMEIGI